jgi:hypothetical protein
VLLEERAQLTFRFRSGRGARRVGHGGDRRRAPERLPALSGEKSDERDGLLLAEPEVGHARGSEVTADANRSEEIGEEVGGSIAATRGPEVGKPGRERRRLQIGMTAAAAEVRQEDLSARTGERGRRRREGEQGGEHGEGRAHTPCLRRSPASIK